MNPFLIDLGNLPGDGKELSGSLPASFFEMPETDSARAESPLDYDLLVVRDGKDLVVTGRLEARFSLECGRCVERFAYEVALDDYRAEIPIEKELTMDLTDTVREDILLALPNFPRCENGNVDPRECPAEGRFDPTEPSGAQEPPAADDRGVWSALDQLK